VAIKEDTSYHSFGTKTRLSDGQMLDYQPTGYYSRKLRASQKGMHHPFDSDNVSIDGGGITGSSWYFDEAFNGFPAINGTWWYPAVEVDEPSFGALAAKLINGTDPTKPDVDIANFIGELKDLPRMLKSIGDSFLNKGVAHAFGHLNLSYKFGWAPFARDVVAMMDFQRLAAKRFEVLQRMRTQGSTIRKMKLFEGESEQDYSFSHGLFNFVTKATAKSDIRGYVIWRTTEDMPSTDSDLMALARTQALGLSMRAEVAWNLLPWSWLVDWFSNVGEFLGANRNRVGCEPMVANITRNRKWYAECNGVPQPWTYAYFNGSVSPLKRTYIIHERFAAPAPSISAHLPILNLSQVGILASIKATRR
jgi:hypothetical protein